MGATETKQKRLQNPQLQWMGEANPWDVTAAGHTQAAIERHMSRIGEMDEAFADSAVPYLGELLSPWDVRTGHRVALLSVRLWDPEEELLQGAETLFSLSASELFLCYFDGLCCHASRPIIASLAD